MSTWISWTDARQRAKDNPTRRIHLTLSLADWTVALGALLDLGEALAADLQLAYRTGHLEWWDEERVCVVLEMERS